VAGLHQTQLAGLAEVILNATAELYALRRYEVTYRLATRGLSVRQEYRRRQGHLSAREEEGGDPDFRFFRSVCHARWSEFEAAEREIEHLRTAIGRTGHAPWRKRLQAAETYLREMRKRRGK
jgi:hypothetical protein